MPQSQSVLCSEVLLFPNQRKAIVCLCDSTSGVCDSGDPLLRSLFERSFCTDTK